MRVTIILTCLFLLTNVAGAATYFTEDFSTPSMPANMQLGTISSGGRGTVDFNTNQAVWSSGSYRICLKTKAMDWYNTSFVFEGTCRAGGSDGWGWPYVGMGAGDNSGIEPENPRIMAFTGGITFHARDNDTTFMDEDSYNPGSGPNRVRMTYNSSTKLVVIEIDGNYNGQFSADASLTLNASDNGFTADNTSLFVGGGDGVIWDDILVWPLLTNMASMNPNPIIGVANVFPPTGLLSWTNPAPKAGGQITCNVYFGTSPNLTTPCFPGFALPQIISNQPMSSVSVNLQGKTKYYWAIDCYDSSPGAVNPVARGLFAFTTIDTNNVFAIQNFQGGTGQAPYTLTQYGGTPAAGIVSGALRMVSTTSQNNVIAFNQTGTGLFSRIVAEWDFNIVPGADGLGFALLNTTHYGVSGAGPAIGEDPSLNGSFAVGFDIYCPDDYQQLGSREISLHWNGIERANKWSGFDYRTGTFNRVRVVVEFVTGGAEITVSIVGHVIYDKYFLAGMTPYTSRPAFGARTGGLQTTLLIDNISVAYESPIQAPPPPLTIRTFDKRLMNISHRDVRQIFSFPFNDTVYERVILRLKVDQPSGGWDPWDRMMAMYMWDTDGQRYEIARFITPYSKAGTWWIDVTDYQGLFRGNRQMGVWLDTYAGSDNPPVGFLITMEFEFYKGQPLYRVVGLRNLWVGTPTYGTLSDPTMSGFFNNRSVSIPNNADKAKLRLMVTGHGQSPNSENAAEFMSRGRTARVNNQSFYNVLWRNDCYLNPCRPQSGTWQYSRAGWAPGDRVWPWDIDISSHIIQGQASSFGYVADAFYNYTPDSGNIARHWVESQVVFYERLLRSDLSGDGAVDYRDFALIAAKWMTTVASGDPADFMPLGRGDDMVNLQEIIQLASEWLIGKE
jgi:hypothetical protein